MRRPIPRLATPTEVREKISASLRGHEVTPETRAKLSAANRGQKRTEEAKAKMRAFWARRREGGPERVLEECRAAAHARVAKIHQRRHDQYRTDLVVAYHSGDMALFQDVLQSQGFAGRRSILDSSGKVSHGMSARGRIVWKRTKERQEPWQLEVGIDGEP